MRHICLYTLDPDFHCVRTGGSTRGSTRGPRGPKKVPTLNYLENLKKFNSLIFENLLASRRCLITRKAIFRYKRTPERENILTGAFFLFLPKDTQCTQTTEAKKSFTVRRPHQLCVSSYLHWINSNNLTGGHKQQPIFRTVLIFSLRKGKVFFQ